MIDDDLVRAHRGARAVAGPSGHPRHGAEPRRLLPGARGRQPLLPRLPDHRAERHGPVRRAQVGRRYRLFDYVGAPDAERVIVLMGSGAETRRGDGGAPRGPGREGRRGQGAPLPAVLGGAFRRRAARHGQDHRRAGPHQGARRRRRAALPGRGGGARRGAAAGGRRRCRASSADATGSRPRNSRRRWSRASSTSWRKRGRTNHFTIGINDDVTHTSLDYDPAFSTEDPATVRAVFYGLGADGTVGRQQELHQDHRRGDRQLRPGLLRLRLEEVRAR